MSFLFSDDEMTTVIKTKRCTECKRDLPTTKFSNASGANYLYHQCRDCTRIQNRLRKKLKLDNPLKDADGHRCPICDRSAKEAFGKGGMHLKSSWVLDHDHNSGKFRGYICHSCNRGLGLFSDSVDTLLKAINYLRQ